MTAYRITHISVHSVYWRVGLCWCQIVAKWWWPNNDDWHETDLLYTLLGVTKPFSRLGHAFIIRLIVNFLIALTAQNKSNESAKICLCREEWFSMITIRYLELKDEDVLAPKYISKVSIHILKFTFIAKMLRGWWEKYVHGVNIKTKPYSPLRFNSLLYVCSQ